MAKKQASNEFDLALSRNQGWKEMDFFGIRAMKDSTVPAISLEDISPWPNTKDGNDGPSSGTFKTHPKRRPSGKEV